MKGPVGEPDGPGRHGEKGKDVAALLAARLEDHPHQWDKMTSPK
jgi:hypothetical protein